MKEIKGNTKRTQEREKLMKIQKEDIMNQVKGSTKRGQEQEKVMEVQKEDIMNQTDEIFITVSKDAFMVKRKCLITDTGETLFPYRVKVHLGSDSKMSMFTDLLECGFRIYDPAYDNTSIFTNAFEIDAIPRGYKSDSNVTLIRDHLTEVTFDFNFVDAFMIIQSCSELSRDFDICPQPINIDTVFHLCQMFKEIGYQDIVDLIKDKNPLITYVTDDEKQDLYFRNPANEDKSVYGFVSYARRVLKKVGIKEVGNKNKIKIKISKMWQLSLKGQEPIPINVERLRQEIMTCAVANKKVKL